MGWSNGPVDNATILALPSSDLMMLSTEGRYHHDTAVRSGKKVLWRAIPRIGQRPAELGWSPSRFVAETINLTDAPSLPITDFVWANELDLRDERGDNEDDWSNLGQRYALIGGWALSVVQGLRQWSPSTRIHWPAWTPDHHALDHLDRWRDAAEACHVVDFHAYDSLANIEREYLAYRRAFPGKPLALTEWHCRGDLHEEERVLRWLAETMADDPLFEAAYFFIWRWYDAPGWWDDDWDVEHRPERLALFMDPPRAQEVPVATNRERYEPVARRAALAHGVDVELFVRQITQESGWNPDAVSPAGATGIAQIVSRFHPNVNPHDPVASLEYAAQLMAGHLAHWRAQGYTHPTDYALALSSYNAGPGATAGGLAGTLPGWPFGETVRYVSVILQVTEAQAARMLVGERPPQEAPVRLSEVLARGRARTGDPYVWAGKVPPETDCSGFAAWCYQGRITPFTDAVLGETERVEKPAPGDIILYEYTDPSQPGVRFPHMGLFISDAVTLDNRFGLGVGEHPQLPRSEARRYYRRLPGVIVDTLDVEAPAPPSAPAPDPRDAELAALRTRLGYASTDIAAALEREAATIEASLGALRAAISTLKEQHP